MQLSLGRERGVTIPETALMMSFISLLLFAIVETGALAYYQVSADGAGFVGGHIAEQTDPGMSVNGPAIAGQIASQVFQDIGAAAVSVRKNTSTTAETDLTFVNPSGCIAGLPCQSTTTSRTIDSTSSTAMSPITQVPPPGSTACLLSKTNPVTGAVTSAAIAGISTGPIATVGGTASDTAVGFVNTAPSTVTAIPGSLAGSLGMTSTSINATLGPNQVLISADSMAQATLATDLASINAAIQDLQVTAPVVGTLLGMQITGYPNDALTGAGAPSTGSLASMLSGNLGDISYALQGQLTGAQATALASLINGTPGAGVGVVNKTGILGVLKSLPAPLQLLPDVQTLITLLPQIPTALQTLNTAQMQIATADAMVANTACPPPSTATPSPSST